jgi:hypothetical protein
MWLDSLQAKESRMGEPSREQIDRAIAWGLANRWSEGRILKHLAGLSRLNDEELAAYSGIPLEEVRKRSLSPSMSPAAGTQLSPSILRIRRGDRSRG